MNLIKELAAGTLVILALVYLASLVAYHIGKYIEKR